MMFKKLAIALSIMLLTVFAVHADEGDVLPEKQRPCYEQPATVNRMELVVPETLDPTVNYDSHYLNNEQGRELSGISYITPHTAVIKLFSGISVQDFIRIHDDLRKLEDYTDIRDVVLVINSPGGSAFDGLSIASLILRYRSKGFTIRAEGYGIVASAAVPILAVCSPRMVVPGTFIMVHEAALWKWPGKETQSDIKTQDQMMTMLNDRYVKFLVDHTKTSEDEWRKRIKATTWMTPEQSVDLGLVDSTE